MGGVSGDSLASKNVLRTRINWRWVGSCFWTDVHGAVGFSQVDG